MADISKVDINRIENLETKLNNYLQLSGGNLVGDVSSSARISASVLKTTASTNLGSEPQKIAVLDNEGTVYFRTPDELKKDIKAGGDADGVTLTKNASEKMQAIGTLEQNKNTAKYDWIGTYAEYTAQKIATAHPNWLCFITDDMSNNGDFYTKQEINMKFDSLPAHEVVTKLPTNPDPNTFYFIVE